MRTSRVRSQLEKITSALPHLRTSAPPHLRTSAPPHLRTSAPPHFRTSAPPIWRKIALALVIFALAVLFRYAHFLDLEPLVNTGRQDFAGITIYHDGLASSILKNGAEAIFPSQLPQISNTNLIHYPPGYGSLLAAVYFVNGRDPAGVQFVQGLLDSIAAVLVFFIMLELFRPAMAFIAAASVAVSHHLAYFSVLLLPDGVVPVFIAAGTLLLLRGLKIGWDKQKGYAHLFAAGVFYGLSCWLRASGMLLWVFWAAAFILTRKYMTDPLKRSLTVAVGIILVIAPLTIRNYRIYGEFIPISLGSGVNLQAGLGEADPSLGFPAKDLDTMRWEAKLYNKPDYELGNMSPDGIFREQERRKRAIEVIMNRPLWYLGVMADRINLMMKYSAHAPLIRRESDPQYASALDPLRPVLRGVQRGFKEGLFPLLIIGLLIGLKNPRRWIILMTIPLYYLLMHSAMHTEFRYALPAHYFLFAFYALAFHALFIALPQRLFFSRAFPQSADAANAEAFEHLKAGPVFISENKSPARDRVQIAGIGVDDLTQSETIEMIDQFIEKREPRMMTVVNASKIVLAREDSELKRVLESADIVTADGMSVVWASRLVNRPLKERVTGIDTFEKLAAHAARKGYSIYLLGAQPEVVEETAKRLVERHPALKIVGYRDGYFGRSEDAAADVLRAKPDILFVAMGSPRQEKWIAANLAALNVPFAIGVGGSFDHVAGISRRAPVWMQRAGFEWLYRLLSEPKRLWKRYLIGNAKFIWLVLRDKSKGGNGGRHL